MVSGSPFAAGSAPDAVAVDPSGRFAYVANYGSDNISAYAINPTTGALTPVSGSPFAAGDGPTAVAVNETGQYLYVANGIATTMSVFVIDLTSGALAEMSGSPIAVGTNPTAIVDHPFAFRAVYVVNRGDNTVSAYTPALTAFVGSPFTVGAGPTAIGFARNGDFYVANGTAGTVSAFSGYNPTATPGSPFTAGTNPVSVAIDRSGAFALVANHDTVSFEDVFTGDTPSIGAATYDRGIYLRKFSHHIAADIDAERDYLFATLANAQCLARAVNIPGVGRTTQGRNGEDDPYFTDGQLVVGWIGRPDKEAANEP